MTSLIFLFVVRGGLSETQDKVITPWVRLLFPFPLCTTVAALNFAAANVSLLAALEAGPISRETNLLVRCTVRRMAMAGGYFLPALWCRRMTCWCGKSKIKNGLMAFFLKEAQAPEVLAQNEGGGLVLCYSTFLHVLHWTIRAHCQDLAILFGTGLALNPTENRPAPSTS